MMEAATEAEAHIANYVNLAAAARLPAFWDFETATGIGGGHSKKIMNLWNII